MKQTGSVEHKHINMHGKRFVIKYKHSMEADITTILDWQILQSCDDQVVIINNYRNVQHKSGAQQHIIYTIEVDRFQSFRGQADAETW